MEKRRTVHLYPTLRCNGRCPYCSNILPNKGASYPYLEKLPGHWIKLIRELQNLDLYFTGGEIFLFPHIKEVMENLVEAAWFYTNAMVLNESFLGKVDPEKIRFRCSYHPGIAKPEEFLLQMEILKRLKFNFQIYIVDTNNNGALELKTRIFRANGYEVGIDYDQRRHIHHSGTVKCFYPTKIVSPLGETFHCVSRMIRHKEPESNLFEGGKIGDPNSVLCDEPKACVPCDMAASLQEEIK
jgi:hypothetical protein